MVKLAKDPLEPHDIAQPTAECQLMTLCERKLRTQRDNLRPVQDGEDIEERVMTSHIEKSEKNENCAKESQEAKVEELQNTKAHLSASLT